MERNRQGNESYINGGDIMYGILKTLEKYKPDIVVITGHDFLKKHAKDKSKIEMETQRSL